MSANFQRVKRDIIRDIEEQNCHSQSSWADILLKHSKYCVTKADQQSLYRFILNPDDMRDFGDIEFEDIDPVDEVKINCFEKMQISNSEDEKENMEEITLENKIYTRGGTTFVITKPITEEYMSIKQKEDQGY